MRESLRLRQQADAARTKAKAARDKGAALVASTGTTGPTAEQATELDALILEAKTQIANAERFEFLAREFEEEEAKEVGAALDPKSRSRALPSSVEVLDDKKPFASFGHQLAAIAAVKMGRANADELTNRIQAAALGNNEIIDSEGGYLLAPEYTQGIEQRMFSTGRLLSLMEDAIPLTGNRLIERVLDDASRATGSRGGAVRGFWLNEADTLTASLLKFKKRETELEKLGALGYATSEMLEDASALGAVMTTEFATELTFLLEDAVIEGNGVGKPLGVLNGAGTVSISKETGQTLAATPILTRNLSKMWAALSLPGKADAVWLINGPELGPVLDELSLPAGTAALEPRFIRYNEQGILTIKGRPVIEIEYCSALGTVGDIILFSPHGYRLVGKGGVRQDTSMHVAFLTDQMAFRAIYRIGGQPKRPDKLTPFKGSVNTGDYVTLATRT